MANQGFDSMSDKKHKKVSRKGGKASGRQNTTDKDKTKDTGLTDNTTSRIDDIGTPL